MSNTATALKMLSRHHKEFISAAKAIAGNKAEVRNYAEDFVQDAYIKLSKYDDLYERIVKDGKVTKGYMFFALRSVIINALKKKSNLDYNLEGDQYDIEERHLLEDLEMTKEFIAINEIEEKMLDVLKTKVCWFDYELFKTYVTTGKSFQTIATESGLGVQTIYLSVKKCKLIIAENLFEDYKNYINGTY